MGSESLESRAGHWIHLAGEALGKEGWERAIAVLREGLEACPEPADKAALHSEAWEVLMRENRPGDAKIEAEAAVGLEPGNARNWDRLILAGCRLGLYKELLQKIAQWQAREPDRYAPRRCKRAVERFRSFSRARPKSGFSYKEEVYGLYGAAALGTPQDNGIDIWQYFFYHFEESDVSHVLFRLDRVMRGMGIEITSVVPSEDGFSLPIALATAEMLRVPIKRVGEAFSGERPLIVKAVSYETHSLMDERARVAASDPARICSFVFSGTRVFDHEIPPDFCAVETIAWFEWDDDVECTEDSVIGHLEQAKAEEYAGRIVECLDGIAEWEYNIDEQVEWYTKKHPHLACLEPPLM